MRVQLLGRPDGPVLNIDKLDQFHCYQPNSALDDTIAPLFDPLCPRPASRRVKNLDVVILGQVSQCPKVSSRASCPGSIAQRVPFGWKCGSRAASNHRTEYAEPWVPGTRPGMTPVGAISSKTLPRQRRCGRGGLAWSLRDQQVVGRSAGPADEWLLAAPEDAVALIERALVDRRRLEPVLLAHLAVEAIDRERVAVSDLEGQATGSAPVADAALSPSDPVLSDLLVLKVSSGLRYEPRIAPNFSPIKCREGPAVAVRPASALTRPHGLPSSWPVIAPSPQTSPDAWTGCARRRMLGS